MWASGFASAEIPGPDIYNLRAKRTGIGTLPRAARPRGLAWLENLDATGATGSNNWVVDGRLSETGVPLLANDMHLGIRVPNTWYRAMLEWRDVNRVPRTVVGITLPGVPAMVVGSNTDVAWGFTNAYADTSDIILLEVDPARPGQYLTQNGWRPFEQFDERIEVAGGPAETLQVSWTEWGPVLPPDFKGRPRAYRWVAHSAERLAVSVTPLEDARSVVEAFDRANRLGTPAQNLVVADREGGVGWTVYGSLPRRNGFDGQLPTSWADGSRGWTGLLDPADYPRVSDPLDGRIWTANDRVVDGAMLGGTRQRQLGSGFESAHHP